MHVFVTVPVLLNITVYLFRQVLENYNVLKKHFSILRPCGLFKYFQHFSSRGTSGTIGGILMFKMLTAFSENP